MARFSVQVLTLYVGVGLVGRLVMGVSMVLWWLALGWFVGLASQLLSTFSAMFVILHYWYSERQLVFTLAFNFQQFHINPRKISSTSDMRVRSAKIGF